MKNVVLKIYRLISVPGSEHVARFLYEMLVGEGRDPSEVTILDVAAGTVNYVIDPIICTVQPLWDENLKVAVIVKGCVNKQVGS